MSVQLTYYNRRIAFMHDACFMRRQLATAALDADFQWPAESVPDGATCECCEILIAPFSEDHHERLAPCA